MHVRPIKRTALTLAGLFLAAIAFVAGATTFESSATSKNAPEARVETRSAVDSAPDSARGSGRALADELSLAFESAAEAVAPSVVAVVSEKTVAQPTQGNLRGPRSPFGDSPFGDLFRFFDRPGQGPSPWGNPPGGRAKGFGSGVIVRADGYVLTNNHVVDGADRVTVVFSDDRELEAEVIGVDPETDLAVVKVDAEDLPAARLGDSSAVRVGQWVIAVGNPFELRHTVTAGIISATGRSTVGLATYEDFIQTDASINPGNSGGALADLDGRVIGINTAISSPSGGNVGIGFAIPIDMAERVMADLIDDGSIERGFLSLIPQDLDESLAKAFGLESTIGALVADVTEGGPAAKAGIETGDVIVGFEGQTVTNSLDLRNRVAAAEPGSEVEVELLREGRTKKVDVELGIRPGTRVATAERGTQKQDDVFRRYGLEATNLTPQLAEQTGYSGYRGVLVTGVDPAGLAARAGLRRGDLIQRVGRSEVESVSELGQLLDSTSGGNSGSDIALLVRRGQGSVYVALPASD